MRDRVRFQVWNGRRWKTAYARTPALLQQNIDQMRTLNFRVRVGGYRP